LSWVSRNEGIEIRREGALIDRERMIARSWWRTDNHDKRMTRETHRTCAAACEERRKMLERKSRRAREMREGFSGVEG